MKERGILFSAPMVRKILAGEKSQTRRVVKHPPELSHYMGRSDDYGHGGYHFSNGRPPFTGGEATWDFRATMLHCPYGQPGDRLWVREAWREVHPLQVAEGRYSQEGRAGIPGPPPVSYRTIYRAEGEYPRLHFDHQDGSHVGDWPYRSVCPGDGCKLRHVHPEEAFNGWVSPIHMSRWASRLTLEVTDVRVERLQAISEADAIAEGFQSTGTIGRDWQSCIDHFIALWDSINGPGSWDANPWVWVVGFRRLDDASA